MNIEHSRHTLAHLLAAAIKELYPEAKPTLGPAIENGFYYDFDFGVSKPSGEDALGTIEATMRKLLPLWEKFDHKVVSHTEAREYFKDNTYKLELIDDIQSSGEEITFYTCGGFTDLCRGGHSERPNKDIKAESFKLERMAGAYWRGNEKKPMLTRVYGLAFENKKGLDEFLTQREEAKKRDHRKLGKELGLFTIVDEIGPGLPLFYPKGAVLRRTIEEYITKLQERAGYVPIWIPHITKGKLYEISGHLDKYDAMYTPMRIDDEDYYLKPMNCPHFMMLYKTLPHSYRELPVRYTSTTTNYRYEKSGELSGLTRVRSLTQDDCHVFCMPEQIEKEITLMTTMIAQVYKTFGFADFWVRISLRDSKNKAKYLGEDEVWDMAENALRNVVAKTGWRFSEAEDEAAFYGPKLDFIFKDVLGRDWQLSTIQLDFNLPKRFELEYTDDTGGKSQPVVIHRAMLGSTERFMGILIEHYAGAFPTWLAPVQVKILPIADAHLAFATEVYETLLDADIRVELDTSNETLGKKIREAKTHKVPYMLVIGDQEVAGHLATLESRDKGKIGQLTIEDTVAKIAQEIKDRV